MLDVSVFKPSLGCVSYQMNGIFEKVLNHSISVDLYLFCIMKLEFQNLSTKIHIYISIYLSTLMSEVVKYTDRNPSEGWCPTPTRPPVIHSWWSVMLRNRIMQVELFLAWQESGQVIGNTTFLALTELDEAVANANPINCWSRQAREPIYV